MATNDNPGNEIAIPSIGLPEPPPVDPTAVASATADDDLAVAFPVNVAMGEPACDGKFWPVEDE